MLISDLQDRLRALVGARIDAGELSGTKLARLAGFQQAHVSNFLNRRRGLSIEAMDRIMEVLGLDVRDLTPEERSRRQPASDGEAGFDSIPVVRNEELLRRDFPASRVIEYLPFKKSFLRRLRPEMANQRQHWQRFVLIEADKDCGAAMSPRLPAGATLLIDRHYDSLRSYRRKEPNLYVVKSGDDYVVRYVELQGDQLTLRPENQKHALGCVRLGKGETFAECVVGRVAHIAMEA